MNPILRDPPSNRRRRPHLWLITALGLIVPRRLRADWKQEWEAELRHREALLQEWEKLNWQTKLDLLRRSLGAFWDALWLQPLRWEDEMIQDLRYGARMLRRNPAFATVVILTLALGIGMNTAVFSVVNAVLLRPLAYPNAERLVWLANYDEHFHQDTLVPKAVFFSWQQQAQSFEGMAAYGQEDLTIATADEASQERITSTTGDFWRITGAQPTLGRLFGPGEPDTIVLSYGLFARRFGSDPQVVGKVLTLNGRPVTVTGVLPKDFRFLFPQLPGREPKETDAYIPLPYALESRAQPATSQSLARGPVLTAVSVVAKLKPDVPIERARAEIETIDARIAQEYPTPLQKARKLHVAPLQEKLVGNARPALRILLAAVVFVLLIASVNIANLLLARASTRRREIAIRVAVGAGRARVIRQFLAESILLALLGGGAGLLFARWAISMMVRLWPYAVPRLGETKIDGGVLALTLMVSLSAGVLFGFAPAIASWRAHRLDGLKDAARTSSVGAGGLRVRGLLVAIELALAMVLLTGAGLLLKSFWRMNAKPPGFAPEQILVLRVSLSGPSYGARPPQEAYMQELLRRIESASGVQAAGIDCGSLHSPVRVEGAPISPNAQDQESFAAFRAVSPGYLRAMGVRLLKGRWPADTELNDAILINESFARSLSDRGDPVGRRLNGRLVAGTIAGVVANFKYWKLDAEPLPEIYMPYRRFPTLRSVRVVVRTSGDPVKAAPAIHQLISAIDRTQPVYDLQTLEQALSDSIAPRRFNMFLLGAFAATALLLALVGIYGVIAYSVTQRTHEIGIRMALGAPRGEVVGMVIRQGMAIALAGMVIGLAAALGLTRLMASLLYDVKPNDPLTLAAVAVTLAATALLACGGPALKAARVDPIIALHHE